jgi:hypothetical protein
MAGMRDAKVTLEFSVPADDADGAIIGAIFDAAVEYAPRQAVGFVGSGNTLLRKAWIDFYLDDVSQASADAVAGEMKARIVATVLADLAVSAA